MIFVVLGMHKSGTTLVSQLIHESGVSMCAPDSSVGYDRGNKYEHQVALELNKSVLDGGYGESVNVVTPLKLESVSAASAERFKQFVISQNSAHKFWGFKDPRACLTFDLWGRTFQETQSEFKILAVFRSPVEVCSHYVSRVKRRKPFARVWAGVKALRAWGVYNQQLLTLLLSSEQPVLVLNYAEVMSEHFNLSRLSGFVGFPVSDVRDPHLQRASATSGLSYLFCRWLVQRLYRLNVDEIFMRLYLQAERE